MRKVLIIAPLSPPITGHSIATEAVVESINSKCKVEIINTSKESLVQGINSFYRVFFTIKLIFKIWRLASRSDIIYYTISQTIPGFLKDLFVLTICFKNLNKFIIHSHGMGIKKTVFNKSIILRYWAKYLFKHIRNLIVLGESHKEIFLEIIEDHKLVIIHNFFTNDIRSTEEEIIEKFQEKKINLLFLSNLIPGKGHLELVDACKRLDSKIKKNIQVYFAGGFQNTSEKAQFMKEIEDESTIKYCGIVSGDEKVKLLHRSHIFCLPTYYKYEGQPISILEAYASGCCVITTNHAGIKDIFIDQENGYFVSPRNVNSLKSALEEAITNVIQTKSMALSNNNSSMKYNKSKFMDSISKLLLNVNPV